MVKYIDEISTSAQVTPCGGFPIRTPIAKNAAQERDAIA